MQFFACIDFVISV